MLTGGEMIPFAEGGKNGYILSALLKGQQGKPGDAGADGKTPVFETGTVTTLDPGTEVSVSVVRDGEDASGNPKYRINVGIPKGYDGSDGSAGKDGVTPSITAKATVDSTSGTPQVSVSKSGADASPVFAFAFTGLKGAPGEDGESGIAPVTDHGTDDTTFELTPNVLHRWGEVASLTLTLGAETPDVVNEYMFQFTSGATATQLSLPETVKWTSTPEIAANTVYQVSIVDNLAVMGGWSNE